MRKALTGAAFSALPSQALSPCTGDSLSELAAPLPADPEMSLSRNGKGLGVRHLGAYHLNRFTPDAARDFAKGLYGR
jgi:hypothetical protein